VGGTKKEKPVVFLIYVGYALLVVYSLIGAWFLVGAFMDRENLRCTFYYINRHPWTLYPTILLEGLFWPAVVVYLCYRCMHGLGNFIEVD